MAASWDPSAIIGHTLLRRVGLPACMLLAYTCAQAADAQPTPEPAATLQSVWLQGRTALPASRIRPYYAALLGQPANAALLEQLRRAVAGAYDEAGQALVSVEVAGIYEGVAVVRVRPLLLARMVVQSTDDAPVAAQTEIAARAALPGLQPGASPHLAEIDRQLRLANLQTHRRWAIDFREAGAPEPASAASTRSASQRPPMTPGLGSQPGQTGAAAQESPAATTSAPQAPTTADTAARGQIDAHVLLSGTSPVYGRLSMDNDGQAATGRERARLQLGHGDAGGPGRALDLTLLTALRKPSAQYQVALRYQHPVPAWGSLFSVEVSRAVSRPGLVQDFFDVSGDSRSVNLSVRHLLPRQGALEPYLEASLERSVHDDVVGFSGVNLGSKVGTSPVSLALGATWQGTDISAFAQARLRHNTAWGGWSGRADYASARAGAAPHWSALDVAGEVRKAMGAGAEWVVRTQAQWSADALIAPQQFRVGGASLMRGLKEGELAGDKGIALALEYWWSLPAQHRVGVLFDSATVRRNQPVAGDVGHASAASAGLAWQWQPMPAVQLQVSAARLVRVHHLPQRSVGDSRVHASLNWTF